MRGLLGGLLLSCSDSHDGGLSFPWGFLSFLFFYFLSFNLVKSIHVQEYKPNYLARNLVLPGSYFS